MKILMVSHYFASHKGGVEIVAEQLFRGLAARKQEVVWMAGDCTPPPESIGASYPVSLRVFNFVEERIGLPFPIPTPGAVKKLAAAVRSADVVILQDCLYLSNIATFLIARFRGVPVIVIQHTRITPYRSSVLNALMRLSTAAVTRPMLARAEQVVFISETTRAFFAGVRFGKPPDVIFNGVDTDLYRPLAAGETKAAIRREYGLPEGSRVILFAGRFVEKKGLSVLKRMAAARPEWIWAFAGWGPLDPRSWNAANVRVFSGLRGSSMAELYRACDLFVLPSTGEGFPLVIQEALASGLPIVCGDETLTADWAMKPFVRGVPVYAGDEDRTAREFLSAVDELVNLGGGQDKSAQCRAFAVSRYSWQNAVEHYLEIASHLAPTARRQAAARHTIM